MLDFDAATLDPKTGELKAEFSPKSTAGGPGDKLHPNRAGYLAMGMPSTSTSDGQEEGRACEPVSVHDED